MSGPRRPCLDCGQLIRITSRSRCEPCRLINGRRGQRHYDAFWRKLSPAVIAWWRHNLGPWCPGFNTAAHSATDLTVDHVEAGSLSAGVTVLCRSCNAAKRNLPETRSMSPIALVLGVDVVCPTSHPR